jgi:hypothetical protein
LLATTPVLALAVTMIEPSLRTPLVTQISATSLLEPRPIATVTAAIAMPPITGRADEKHCLTTAAHPLSENCCDLSRRHASSQAALDKGTGFVAGWNQLCLVYLTKVAEPRDPVALTAGFLPAFADKILLYKMD